MRYDLEKILDFLVGHISIACETNWDNESYDNLDILEYVLNYCIAGLYENARYCNDYRASANKIANKSLIIANDAKLMLEDVLSMQKKD